KQPLDALPHFFGLFTMLASRCHDNFVDVGCETKRRSFDREQTRLAVAARVVAHADVEASARVSLHPIESKRAWPEALALHDRLVRANRDMRRGTPEQQRAILGGERGYRQARDFGDGAGAVVIVGRGADLAARPPRLPRP